MSVPQNISLIAALSRTRLIGTNGSLPWRLPKDLQIFKRLTTGKKILMGRKTFESIGKPLPNRENLVLSRSEQFISGTQVFSTVSAALASIKEGEELMIIGGGEVYKQCLPIATRLYLSVVEGDFNGDAFFPTLTPKRWSVQSLELFPKDEKNAHDFGVYTLTLDKEGVCPIPSFLLA